MKLSVVIPVYNGADFIQKSYNSIMEQQVDDFEIIYVDNNSTDDSVEKINKILHIDPRVKLLQQPKQGAAPARNMGIENASGQYVYVFDVDDEIYPNALEEMIKVLDEHPNVDAVFGKMTKSYKGISETEKPEAETGEVILKPKPYWGLKWFSDLKIVVGPPAFLYRKEIFRTMGGYNESFTIGEDTAFDIKVGMQGNIAFLDKYVYLYFKHEKSTIQNAKKRNDRAFMQWPRYMHSHLPYYLDNPVPDEYAKILFKWIYSMLGRMINLTEGIKNRKELKDKLMKEIKPIKTPFYIKTFLEILVLSNNPFLFKFYIYYLMPKSIPWLIKHNKRLVEK